MCESNHLRELRLQTLGQSLRPVVVPQDCRLVDFGLSVEGFELWHLEACIVCPIIHHLWQLILKFGVSHCRT